MANLYRRKLITVEAERFDGTNGKELAEWCGGYVNDDSHLVVVDSEDSLVTANSGDWVVLDGADEYWVMPDDMFQTLFESQPE
jgi:hypothetical protein